MGSAEDLLWEPVWNLGRDVQCHAQYPHAKTSRWNSVHEVGPSSMWWNWAIRFFSIFRIHVHWFSNPLCLQAHVGLICILWPNPCALIRIVFCFWKKNIWKFCSSNHANQTHLMDEYYRCIWWGGKKNGCATQYSYLNRKKFSSFTWIWYLNNIEINTPLKYDSP